MRPVGVILLVVPTRGATLQAVMVLKQEIRNRDNYRTTRSGISSSIKRQHHNPGRRWKKSAGFTRWKRPWTAGSRWTTSSRPFKPAGKCRADRKSEEHTSELQSLRHLVCRLL